jgi:mannose-1-phosphate guanylyltransferase
MNNLYVVIMAGGIGSRFWPYSRTSRPKQFLDILGTGKSLLQLTYERFLLMVPKERILVVTNESYTPLVQEHLPDLPTENILGEPIARNTAPCVAYAAYRLMDINPNAICVVAPSDHLIVQEEAFRKQIEKGVDFVSQQNALLTLGIQPNRPDTGYGYIQFVGKETTEGVHKVKTFTEKPGLEMAKQFLDSGEFLWNSGIFIWKAADIIKAFVSHLPEIDELFRAGKFKYAGPAEKKFIAEIYPKCANVSIDYGIVEKASNVYVLPSDFGWSDLGTWKSLHEHMETDENGNAGVGGQQIFNNSHHCLVMTRNDKMIVLEGVDNMFVIDTDDALLVCNRDQEQKVKAIVSELKTRFNGKFN